eukprot:gene4660-9246_t
MDVENQSGNIFLSKTVDILEKGQVESDERPKTCPEQGNRICKPSTSSSVRSVLRNVIKDSVSETISKVYILKQQWAKEKEEKLAKNKERKELERKKIEDASKIASENRSKRIEKQRQFEEKEKNKLKEVTLSSLTAKSQLAKDLERQEKEKRRQSIVFRLDMAKRADEVEKKKKQSEKEFQQSILLDRRIDAMQIKEHKQINESKKRQSLAKRVQKATQDREYDTIRKQMEVEVVKDIVEVRRDLGKPDIEVERKKKEKARKSFLLRTEAWKRSKQIEEQQRRKALEDQHENSILKKAESEDILKYKQEQTEHEKIELQRQLEEWRQVNKLKDATKAEMEEALSYEAELREQEKEDVLAYQMKMNKIRRESLNYHAEMARLQRKQEEDQRAEALEQKELDRLLKAGDRQALEYYKQEQQELRRKSLAFRNKQASLHRSTRNTMRTRNAEVVQEETELQRADRLALETAKTEERDRARLSLTWALVQDRKHKEIELMKHRTMLDRMHEEFELRKRDLLDIKTDKAERVSRSRKSVTFRLQSWKQQRMVEEKLLSQEKFRAEEGAAIRAADVESVRLAKQALQSKMKIDSIIEEEFLI